MLLIELRIVRPIAAAPRTVNELDETLANAEAEAVNVSLPALVVVRLVKIAWPAVLVVAVVVPLRLPLEMPMVMTTPGVGLPSESTALTVTGLMVLPATAAPGMPTKLMPAAGADVMTTELELTLVTPAELATSV